MCCDLWRQIWNDPYTKKNGRSGQKQCGVDICGSPAGLNTWEGVQCKGKTGNYDGKITIAELNAEVEKAKEFRPSLSRWILATTGRKDAAIEQRAREITEQHSKEGLFRVEIMAWEDIAERLAQYPDILQRYYSDVFPPATYETNRVQVWIDKFLTPLIEDAETVLEQFKSCAFIGKHHPIGGGEYYWIYYFVDIEFWREHASSRTAVQFLKQYDSIAVKNSAFVTAYETYIAFIEDIIENILSDEKIYEIIRQRYENHLASLSRTDRYDKSLVEMLREIYHSANLKSLAAEDERITFFTSRFLTYAIFGYKVIFAKGVWQDQCLWDFCSEIVTELGDYNVFANYRKELERLQQEVISKLDELLEDASLLRAQLCAKFLTTY